MSAPLSRREFLSATVGASAALWACSKRPAPRTFGGRLLGQSDTLGHRLRKGGLPEPKAKKKIGTLIIGGGASGLSAAWRLTHAGETDFLLLELEEKVGGTSAYERRPDAAYPFGAHYIPVPAAENRSVVKLLTEVGAVTGIGDDGEVICAEEMLCRAPQERLFFKGDWYEGLYLRAGASASDLRQLEEFNREVASLAAKRDASGRRPFTLPVARCSDDAEFTALDKISMATFMDQQGWTSPRLRWWVDYACRDDFGLRLEQTSAWAGLFYFAARITRAGDRGAEFLTWPEGNGRLIRHLEEKSASKLRRSTMVTAIIPGESGVEVRLLDTRTDLPEAYLADQVIFALPKFLARHLIAPWRETPPAHLAAFRYGSWVTANIALEGRPGSRGFPTAWDNVLHDSRSLGYVVSTHQAGKDTGPTVWTWYLPLCDDDPKIPRNQLLGADWAHWADAMTADLTRAHSGFLPNVKSVDVWRWGHAMVRPEVGFLWGGARQQAAEPLGRIEFANTDLSGVALFEEAHFHGVRAAEAVLKRRGVPVESFL